MKSLFLACVTAALGGTVQGSVGSRCASLTQIYDSDSPTQVHTAKAVPAGGLDISSEGGNQTIQNRIPICHVQGTIKYSEGQTGHAELDASGEATLTWELFLPEHAEYNGRYLGVGNGGYAGIIDNYTMLKHLNTGYAVGGCDSGHHQNENGNNTGYAPYMEDLAKVNAWIHDSIALTTRVARDSITTKYYVQPPTYSYYYGCSTGGGQGYSLAEFYPGLFDGIYAEGPGNYYTHLVLSFLWNMQHTNADGFLNRGTLNFMAEKVLDACDGIDAVKDDGVIENPLKCSFDIQTLECKPGQNPVNNNRTVCLTTSQVQAARSIYRGAKDARDGKIVYPGFNLGTESTWLGQQTVLFESYGAPILRQLVFNDTNYDAVQNFNWGSDLDAVDTFASPLIDGITADLSAFHRRGGKFITAQGWADPINAATWPMRHLEDIQSTMGPETVSEFMRLFMVPGGGHCGANPAYPQVPAEYHVLDALVEWVESGKAPDEGVLSSSPPDGSSTTRRLCPWPKQAGFLGGDHNGWESYKCVETSAIVS
ncbi:Tannase/feruloyl esterase [Aspergillus cavernicola]|uniref:Carboxylic ester hydrolase n=1 Tax=Aspergillus cavernicola TaxID=176166 RepID=A0ABR4IPI6_9EURO